MELLLTSWLICLFGPCGYPKIQLVFGCFGMLSFFETAASLTGFLITMILFSHMFPYFSPSKLISKALKEAQALAQSGTQVVGKNKHFADQ